MAAALYTSEGIPKSPGILGATPGNPGLTRLIQGSDVQAQFEAGELPASVDELVGEEVPCYGKGDVLVLDSSSVLEYNWGGSAGYGDPLLRDPERVFGDVAAGVVSAADADHQYGVVIRDGSLDAEATRQRRDRLRRERLAAAGMERDLAAPNATPPASDLVIGEDIWVDRGAAAYRYAHCRADLGGLSEHTKQGMAIRERPPEDIGTRMTRPPTWTTRSSSGSSSVPAARRGSPPKSVVQAMTC